MPRLDLLRSEGLSGLSHDTSAAPAVLNTPIGPYVEDLFRYKKHNFGNQKLSKEIRATVRYYSLPRACDPITNYCSLQSPWPELDNEDLAFRRHGPTSLLGSTPELGAWYGGKVSFTMGLQANKKGLQFFLEHPVLGSSSRFTRCYGSSWLIRVKLSHGIFSKPDKLESLKNLLHRPLVLNGQVFRFFYARSIKKDSSVFLMATNELFDGSIKPQHSPLNGQRVFCSFLDFFSRHNNLQDNSHQVTHLSMMLP